MAHTVLVGQAKESDIAKPITAMLEVPVERYEVHLWTFRYGDSREVTIVELLDEGSDVPIDLFLELRESAAQIRATRLPRRLGLSSPAGHRPWV
jgi:hypothetical protein